MGSNMAEIQRIDPNISKYEFMHLIIFYSNYKNTYFNY